MGKGIYRGKRILVTGASSGIGLEFAKALSKHSCELVLTSRKAGDLDRVKASLSNEKAAIFCIAADLAKLEGVKRFWETLKEKNLIPDILINNAGKQSYGYFYKMGWQKEFEIIGLNCLAPVYLMHCVLPFMEKKGFGKILNVGSVAGTMPVPFFATYAASKAFLVSFSQAISEEMREKNVSCACLLPGNTASERFWKVPKLGKSKSQVSKFASPAKVASYGLALLESGKDYGVYGFGNKAKQFAKRLVPRKLLNSVLRNHCYSIQLEESRGEEHGKR